MGSAGGGGGPGSILFRVELLLVIALALAYKFSWARAWTVSGATVLSVLLVTSDVSRADDDIPAEDHDNSIHTNSHDKYGGGGLSGPSVRRRGGRRGAGLPVPLLVALVNVLCAASSTSWLFYWVFTVGCWATIVGLSLSRFPSVGDFVRRRLRSILRHLQFTADKVALFELPALELDVGLAGGGLMVIRGATLSLSSLTLEAHGVEVGIKLSDDLELAIQTDCVTVALFRHVDIADVFACLKGGRYEMTFGCLEPSSKDSNGDALMDSDTPLLRAATTWKKGNSSSLSPQDGGRSATSRKSWNVDEEGYRKGQHKIPMTQRMTNGRTLSSTSVQEAAKSVTPLIADDEHAARHYKHTMEHISKTSEINKARKIIQELVATEDNGNSNNNTNGKGASSAHSINLKDEGQVRAAICTQLHTKASIQHPPEQSIKVSTLKQLSSPATRRFMHRLPMLLRLLLSVIAQFHSISISSVTATASGRWVKSLLGTAVFKSYAEQSSDIRRLRDRVYTWLSDANFALQLGNIAASALVPFFADGSSDNGVLCRLLIDDIVAYRTLLPHGAVGSNTGTDSSAGLDGLVDVVRLSGADAIFSVPTCLLPHHEHLLPPRKAREAEARRLQKRIDDLSKSAGGSADAVGRRIVRMKKMAEQAQRDEINATVAAHVRLPARFDQELLNFVAALVKATKIIEFEKGDDHLHNHHQSNGNGGDDSSGDNDEVHGFREFSRVFSNNMKEGVKRATVNAAANDRWIAKLIGKVTRKLQVMQGDVGYSGDIPINLKPYRDTAEKESKILP